MEREHIKKTFLGRFPATKTLPQIDPDKIASTPRGDNSIKQGQQRGNCCFFFFQGFQQTGVQYYYNSVIVGITLTACPPTATLAAFLACSTLIAARARPGEAGGGGGVGALIIMRDLSRMTIDPHTSTMQGRGVGGACQGIKGVHLQFSETPPLLGSKGPYLTQQTRALEEEYHQWFVPKTRVCSLERTEKNTTLTLATIGFFFSFFHPTYYHLRPPFLSPS